MGWGGWGGWEGLGWAVGGVGWACGGVDSGGAGLDGTSRFGKAGGGLRPRLDSRDCVRVNRPHDDPPIISPCCHHRASVINGEVLYRVVVVEELEAGRRVDAGTTTLKLPHLDHRIPRPCHQHVAREVQGGDAGKGCVGGGKWW